MKIKQLKLRNFKGVRDFTLDAQGGNITILGDNATGKTTLFDAFSWLLFDKDSLNRKDFDIKTLDKTGKPLHGLEHEVGAELDLAGQTLSLRKVYKEVWTKKRGSAQAEFTGHTTDYFIDSVPVQKTEYNARINGICDEQTFRLLTDVNYFNEQLHWQQRRKLLLDVCGDVSDKDVIDSKPMLKDLPAIIGKRSLDDMRKIIQSRRTEINKELDKIPVRMDEVQRGLPEMKDVDAERVREDIKAEERNRAQLLVNRTQIEVGGGVAEKIKQLRVAEAALIEIENREHQSRLAKMQPLRIREAELLRTKAQLEVKLQDLTQIIARHQEAMVRLDELRTQLRAEWHRVNDEKFIASIDNTCPACGQTLPEEAVREAREKAETEFNRCKSQRLEQVASKGKATKSEIEERKQDISIITAETIIANEQLSAVIDELQELCGKMDIAANGEAANSARSSKELSSALAQVKKLQYEIERLRHDNVESLRQVDTEVAVIDAKLFQLRGVQARIERHTQNLARMEELKVQQRQLAAELERLEKELYLTEEFVRTKVSMLEERINGRFKLARFKLFDVQINGAVAECCETTFGGVPYGSGLNRGARTNVGLDIINTLSQHYGFAPPVWIDNAESVVELLSTRGQLIRLVVSGEDKKLRLEIQEREAVLA